MKYKKDILIIGVIILSGAFLFVSASRFIDARDDSANAAINYRNPILPELDGQSLPSFKLLLPDSSTYVDISSALPDKPVVLFYFGPDCPHCHEEMLEIIEEMDKLQNIQFYLFTAYPFDEMRRFYENFRLSRYPNIVTGYDYKFFFFEHFKIKSVPGIVIYGKDRRLKGTFIGNINYKQILDLSRK